MKQSINVLIKLSLFIFLWGLSSIVSAKISLTLDRSDIHANETFHLRVQVEESNTLNAGANLDFIPEKITIRSRQEYNSSIIVNGQYNTQMGWDFELLAEEAGTYTIPALDIGNERSEPFTIRVLPAQDDLDNADNAKIKLRANISDEEVYVQQQLIFTVRIYRSVVARNQQITPIRVTNALVEQLGENKSFDVVNDGNNFRVVEQRYAIFPQQSGDMVIEPMTYSATILEDTNNRSPWQRSQLKPVSLSTQKYTVKVKPKPQNAAEPWLPAKKVELEAEWQPKNQTFTVGNPASLDFIIKGIGLLKTQLPTVTFPEQDGITIYRDTPQYRQRFNRFGVNSYHFEKVAVIPSDAGEITIPEVKIPWWNVETDQQEYATLPAQTIRVEPSSEQINNVAGQTVIPEDQQRAIQQTNSTGASTTETNTTERFDYWKYISLALVTIWLITLLVWYRQNGKTNTSNKAKNNSRDASADTTFTNSSLKEAINHAKNNNAQQTAQALARWLKHSSEAKHLKATNLSQLADYCRQSGQSALADELGALQQHLYAKAATLDNDSSKNHQWNGAKLAKLLGSLKLPNGKQPLDSLPKLYGPRQS